MSLKPELAFLNGRSVMARLMREKQWAGTPFGPPQEWPQSLRSVVDLMLGSAFPMFVAWGPDLNTLYITTVRYGLSASDLAEQPLAGGIFALDAGVKGIPDGEFAG